MGGSVDGLFHILCTWDGGTNGPPTHTRGTHCHFVVDLKMHPLGDVWTYVGSIEVYNVRTTPVGVPIAGEPTPVYEGGPPGDGAKVRYFIARQDAIGNQPWTNKTHL